MPNIVKPALFCAAIFALAACSDNGGTRTDSNAGQQKTPGANAGNNVQKRYVKTPPQSMHRAVHKLATGFMDRTKNTCPHAEKQAAYAMMSLVHTNLNQDLARTASIAAKKWAVHSPLYNYRTHYTVMPSYATAVERHLEKGLETLRVVNESGFIVTRSTKKAPQPSALIKITRDGKKEMVLSFKGGMAASASFRKDIWEPLVQKIAAGNFTKPGRYLVQIHPKNGAIQIVPFTSKTADKRFLCL